MSHYSVTPWKFSTLLLLTTLFCLVAECVTMGHEDMRADLLNGPQAAGRLSPKLESLFMHTYFMQAHMDTNRELILSQESDKL